MALNTDTGSVEVEEIVIYEDRDPRGLLRYFNKELPREVRQDDGSHGMELWVWYGMDAGDDMLSAKWEHMQGEYVLPLLLRLATPDTQMITEDGKRWELGVREVPHKNMWQLYRIHYADDPLWKVVKSDDQVTDPWRGFPPDEVDTSAVDGLTSDAWNWLTRNDAFFGRFEYAIRSALHEFVAKDLGDAEAQAIAKIVDDARAELGVHAKIVIRRAFRRILARLQSDDEGGDDRTKGGIGTKGTT
jgi:hypothetical protein